MCGAFGWARMKKTHLDRSNCWPLVCAVHHAATNHPHGYHFNKKPYDEPLAVRPSCCLQMIQGTVVRLRFRRRTVATWRCKLNWGIEVARIYSTHNSQSDHR